MGMLEVRPDSGPEMTGVPSGCGNAIYSLATLKIWGGLILVMYLRFIQSQVSSDPYNFA